MTLLSIQDDFRLRTLAKIPGLLGKLYYLSQLREEGSYVHWGLARTYGEEITQLALQEVHREVFIEVLRTRLRDLVKDLTISAAGKQMAYPVFLDLLIQNSPSLLSAQVGGDSIVHFNSIIAALAALLGQPLPQS